MQFIAHLESGDLDLSEPTSLITDNGKLNEIGVNLFEKILNSGYESFAIEFFDKIVHHYIETGELLLVEPETGKNCFLPEGTMAAVVSAEEPPPQQKIKPAPCNHVVMVNNQLMSYLQKDDVINSGPFDMPVLPQKGNRPEITSYVIVDFEQGNEQLKSQICKLTEFERTVFNAIVSLYEAAEKVDMPPIFTTDMIHRAMPGGSDKASPQQKGAYTKAIEKFRRLRIYVDATEELRARKKIKDTETVIFDDYFLSALRVQMKTENGDKDVTAYRLRGIPLPLEYGRYTGQILTVNSREISVKKVKNGALCENIAMTPERQAMTSYLLRRIGIMKHEQRNKKKFIQYVISFDSVFEQVDITTEDRKQRMFYRDFCFNALDYWIATNYIKGYEKQVNGRKITGVKIIL